ncbi:hypothetical protein QUF72_19100 [Desulfobacterales bacterium HSG2]|nr:hypothetical protein [Desulfobacterales bacterium HSG2]
MLLLVLPLIMNDSGISATENQIVLVTQKHQESPAGKFLDMVYTEAFKRLGMMFVYKQYPAKRASFMSDSGKADGELSRIHSYNEVHPNVIRVGEPHWTSGFIAVAADPSVQLDGWESLKKTDYRVNYRRGIKGCEVNLPKVVRPERLEKLDKVSRGYKKLLAARADIFIGSEMDMVSVLKSDEFGNSDLRIAGVMERFTGHAFLHKKHRELVPKLSDVLKEMKKGGLFEKYRNTAKLMTYFKD